jgi:hypothetical protein
MIKITDKQISNGQNTWVVSGVVSCGRVLLTEIHGDICDQSGIREALLLLLSSKPRYLRICHVN